MSVFLLSAEQTDCFDKAAYHELIECQAFNHPTTLLVRISCGSAIFFGIGTLLYLLYFKFYIGVAKQLLFTHTLFTTGYAITRVYFIDDLSHYDFYLLRAWKCKFFVTHRGCTLLQSLIFFKTESKQDVLTCLVSFNYFVKHLHLF